MSDAIQNAQAMLRAIGDAARDKYKVASGEDVAWLNGAARSMEWLARHIENDDEANMISVALQSALTVGQALNTDQWAALNAKFGPPKTKPARDARTAAVSRRREVLKEFLELNPTLADNNIPDLADIFSRGAHGDFKTFLEDRDVLIGGRLPSISTFMSDLKHLRGVPKK